VRSSQAVALKATIHNFDVELADVDRGVYETLALCIARQPSETAAYMVTRLLAYCLEYREGIVFTEGVAAGDQPAVCVRDLTGKMTAWIEVGMPDADRLHRGAKLAERVAVYTHRDPDKLVNQLAAVKIHQAADIPILAFDPGFVDRIAESIDRRSQISLFVTERHLYLELDGRTFETSIVEYRIPSLA
jgi:uncharacterized protein YaeQ